MNKISLLIGVSAFSLFAFSTPANAKDTYFGVYGGANWNDVVDSPLVDDNSGTVLGAVAGFKVNQVPGLRLELDASYRTNEVDILGGLITADHDTTALLGNVVYDLPAVVAGGRPYVLAGVGVASTEATFENVSLLKLEASGVAWQLGTGMNWDVADGITAGVGYRYFQGPELDVLGTELSDGSNHSVVASVNFAF